MFLETIIIFHDIRIKQNVIDIHWYQAKHILMYVHVHGFANQNLAYLGIVTGSVSKCDTEHSNTIVINIIMINWGECAVETFKIA